ncbi:short-chain dehydrogenase [Pseudomonas aeruginosa]|uniref:SDR family NAD(P)-dependent oxidoreductase n=1 Tax=Pseudomonas aeruginosa TaxID=287 RepID=UPI000D6F1869|nr:SDR family NAD(P)-dependent oxidoreductase [Pseudomonas aeruginosa]ELK4918973.1 SDR family NAD(P)-dependent oxidoreductase [Pseudomonas aeruginosa]MCP9254300.1 SDR family NAD(P)-dependent oxidoreductase [Pseudomonas aeruginosa]MCS8549167.1 SDR family NAD(P)-dependent oxidoreductase [Pseudomonas aeruginosa]MCT1239331.1 SDR family NAD(P)-dependent oxidoreductase [Pseudomonas aeruginosa]MDA3425344.1 SDR family NAD(P)-dependent oxidoreductase [Pseudomonas aeruginosa]
MSTKKLAIVTGVGPGTGTAIVRHLVGDGFQVAMIARNAQRLEELAHELPDTYPFPVDVTDTQLLEQTLDRIQAQLGHADVLVHNAIGGTFGSFLEIDPQALATNFQTNVMSLLHLSRRLAPAMIEKGEGAIIITGNTSALRGKSRFAGFAPTKAAQRILSESIARELGPKGIHVAYVIIDAVIDLEWTRKMHPTAPDEFFIQPANIAAEVGHLIQQPKSAWSFLAEIRPYGEKW